MAVYRQIIGANINNYLKYYNYLFLRLSSISMSVSKTSRLSGINRYFIVIIYTYQIVRKRIRNGYHGNTLQVKEYTLTSKLSLPVR